MSDATALVEIKEIISRALIAHAVLDADEISLKITAEITKNFGGTAIYIQKKSVDFAARNNEIYRKFNGRNARQLCRSYDLCYQQICRIIQNHRTKRQSDLFQ